MHLPYRTPAIPEPEPPDLAAAFTARLRRRARGTIGVALLGAFAAGFLAHALATRSSSAQRRADVAAARAASRLVLARETIAEARRAAELEQARFAAAIIAAADANLALSAEPCPIRPDAARLLGARAIPLLVVDAWDRDLPSPSVSAILTDVRRAEALLADGRTSDAVLYANALSRAGERLTADVVVFAAARRQARRTSASTFEPGEIAGRAVLYDFTTRSVRCAGEIAVQSSTRIEYSYVPGATAPAALDQGPRLSASLDLDLDRQLQLTLAREGTLRVSR